MERPEPVAGPGRSRGSDRADGLGLRALGALHDLELHALVLVQRAVAVGLDRGVVHEHVGAAAVHGDEAEALLRVEPLHGSLRHSVFSSEIFRGPTRCEAGWPFSSSASRGSSHQETTSPTPEGRRKPGTQKLRKPRYTMIDPEPNFPRVSARFRWSGARSGLDGRLH